MWILNFLFTRSQGSSESKIASLVGQTAILLTPIPENGVGEIAYVQGGTRYTAPARAESHGPIAQGETVRINRIVGTQFYVEPVGALKPTTSTDRKSP